MKKGDAIIKIAKKFDMTAAHLKQFNDLKDDRIRVGQMLRIPTPGQLLTMVPPPPPPPPEPKKEVAGKKKTAKFLHRINQPLKGAPVVGSEFQVPNVIPFEIEKALDPPLQPAVNPQKPVTAAVVVLSRLEISCERKLIAVMPLASARPGLHGRGSWTVLDSIPQPRMATKREPRETPKEKPASAGDDIPRAKPVIEPPLESEQSLAPGPNNPVGIIWINLAKAGSTDPLPYGLHGTSIPARMSTLKGIGGLRLANWDLARSDARVVLSRFGKMAARKLAAVS